MRRQGLSDTMTRMPPTFWIFERDLFVATDMGVGLTDASPGCQVRKLREVAEINGHDPAPGSIFITKLSLADLQTSGLIELSRRVTGRIVIRAGQDPDQEVLARGFELLPSPFSNRDLRELVERLNRATAA